MTKMTDLGNSTPNVTPQQTPSKMRDSVERRISCDLINQLEHMDAANRFMIPKTKCVTDLDNAILRHDVQQPGCNMILQPDGIECCELRTNNPNQFDDFDFAKKCVELQQFYNTVIEDRGLAEYLEKIKDYFFTIHDEIEHEITTENIPILDFSDCSNTTIDNIIDLLTATKWDSQFEYQCVSFIAKDTPGGHRSSELVTQLMIDNTLSCISYDCEMLLVQATGKDYGAIDVHQIPAVTEDENSDMLSRAMIAISNVVEIYNAAYVNSQLQYIKYTLNDCINNPAVLLLNLENVKQLVALVLVVIRNKNLKNLVIRLAPVSCSQKMSMVFLKLMSGNADICDEGTMHYSHVRSSQEHKFTYTTEIERVFIRFDNDESLCTITKYREEVEEEDEEDEEEDY